MNKIVTSKEAILNSAKEIAYRDGISKLNIRTLASECGVSVGSIYNYFPTKDDLVIAVIEEFWKNIFQKGMCDHQINLCFVQFYEKLYFRFYNYLKVFKEDMISQLSLLSKDIKQKGRSKEDEYLNRMKSVMMYHLKIDESIRKDVWTENFTMECFIDFAFDNMFLMLKNNQMNIEFFKELITKLIY